MSEQGRKIVRKKSCVIIGAGLAGLAAGYWLKQKGWDVTILEARSRLGGRVYTYHFRENPDLYCELGAEWIGQDHKRLKQLCKEFGLALIPHLYDFSFAERGKIGRPFKAGAWPFTPGMKKVLEEKAIRLTKQSQAVQHKFDKQDWWTFLGNLRSSSKLLRHAKFSDRDLLRRDLMDSTDFGESIRHVGAYSALSEYYGEDRNETDEMDLRIKGGNTRLVNALAERIGLESIHTCMEVKNISDRKGVVTVEADDTRTVLFAPPHRMQRPPELGGVPRTRQFNASYCICTVPARVLADIQLSPNLPRGHHEAATQLQYARIMKTAMLFENRFWERKMGEKFSCFTDGTSDFIFAATLGQQSQEGILCSYAIGDKSDDLAARGTEQLRESIERDLTALFPGENTRSIATVRYAWQEDKYTQGAYALYRPGQWFPIRQVLRQPHGRIHFAGEHLADEQGFMEGAVDSGEEAAKQIHDAQK